MAGETKEDNLGGCDMFLFDNIKPENLDNLPSYARKLFEELKPIIEKISLDKIDSNNSKVEIKQIKKDLVLNIIIVAKDKQIPAFLE